MKNGARNIGLVAAVAALGALWSACSAGTAQEPFGGSPTAAGGGGAGGGGGGTGTSTSTGGGGSSGLDTDDDGDGYAEVQGDCNDQNADIHPGAVEICDDGSDNNCNGVKDASEPDADGDGFGPCQGDCNDADPNTSPVAQELPGDGVDNNCDGVVDGDYDGDGYTAEQGDCDDANAAVHPNAKEDCANGVDDDCDGFKDAAQPDADGDGFGPCQGDCNDADPSINPKAPEVPGDGLDNNCDNLVDEDIDGDGWTVKNGDCDDNDPAINPAANEDCKDQVDNNCNGIVDADCFTPCDLAAAMRSSVGCVYYGVDCENYGSYNALQYAVVVSNVSAKDTANVTVQLYQNNAWTTIQNAAVGPLSLKVFNLPDRHITGTGLFARGAYRVVSDYPVIAYQFNPIDGQSSYTSDASLLLPTSSLDTHHQMVGYPQTQHGAAQAYVIASEDDTQVTVTSSIATVGGGPIPALQPGVPTPMPLLKEGDFIQISSAGVGKTFNGTSIVSNKPVSVLSAHVCVNIPPDKVACDHLEEEMFGLQTWGKEYVASRMPVRSINKVEATIWDVYASEDGTQIEFVAHPEVTGLPVGPQVLNAGKWLQLSVAGTKQNPGDFVVKASKPIHIMAYLTCSSNTDAPAEKAGDPAMTQMVPVAQYLDSYVVLVPPNWIYDFFIITKHVGETVTVDGNPVAQNAFVPINNGKDAPEWEVARISATDGAHKVKGSKPCGIVVVGYDSYDSYAYPGGLNQQLINPIK
ncbi:MAG: hypothetical protein HY744_03465 [Deltaproteobacteria bacterium]|nr:hypothetical protein [Deltaproteobacteria bacterium]